MSKLLTPSPPASICPQCHTDARSRPHPHCTPQVEEATARIPEQHQAVAELLADIVAVLRQVQAAAAAAPAAAHPAAALSSLRWLIAGALGLGSAVLSKANVAALFLSRRILLVDLLPPTNDTATQRLRATLSAALFIVSVEGTWQAHERVMPRVPVFVQRAAAPLRLGLRLARVAVWSAAFVLITAGVRGACSSAATSAAVALAHMQLPRRLVLQGAWRRLQGGAAEGGQAACNAAASSDAPEGTSEGALPET